MTDYMPGGRRRIDRVLDPTFVQGVHDLDLEEIRVRRADADQEEVDLSYARRLLQGRLDLLKDERDQRASGAGPRTARSDAELAQALSKVLADSSAPRSTHGLGRHISATPSRLGEHRREAERAVADVATSDLGSLSDDQLEQQLERLSTLESRVSGTRRAVQQVADLLAGEIARRYQVGEVEVAPLR